MTDLHISGLVVVRGREPVLHGIDLDVAEGEWIGVIGPNGAGKSTLLHTMAGGLPYSGQIWIGHHELRRLPARARARTFALVPQDPVIPPGMLVHDYVMLGRTPHLGLLQREGGRDLRAVGDALAALRLDEVAGRGLDTLSGGQLQRVVIARAMAQASPVLLLDEPTSALDVGHRVQVLEEVEALRVERSLTVITALHDLTLAAQFCDRLVLLSEGRVAGIGPAASVLTESAIRRHYGADVTLIDGPDGTVIVVPMRRGRSATREEAAR